MCNRSAPSSEPTAGILWDASPQTPNFLLFLWNVSLHLELGWQWSLHTLLNIHLSQVQFFKMNKCEQTSLPRAQPQLTYTDFSWGQLTAWGSSRSSRWSSRSFENTPCDGCEKVALCCQASYSLMHPSYFCLSRPKLRTYHFKWVINFLDRHF